MRLIQAGTLLAAAGAILTLAACSQDLTIPNTNAPSTKVANSTPDDIKALAATSIQTWHDANNEVNPSLALSVMADALTGSFNNFGMNLSSSEPRLAYPNNTTGGDYTSMAQDPWYNNYTALGEANDAIRAIDGGIFGDDTVTAQSYKALSMLTQGLAMGNIALIFDQGFIVDESTPVPVDYSTLPLVKYPVVAAAALAKLDAVIAATQGKHWSLPTEVLPLSTVDLTAENLGRIASTMAARLVAYTPRNGTENAAADWAKVLTYAENGISAANPAFDFAIIEDGGNLWWDGYKAYGNYGPWLRVSMRVMHEMNPALPSEYTSCASIDEDAAGFHDARYATDFTYKPLGKKIPFSCARGAWHFSDWEHSRYGLNAGGAGDVTWYSGTFTGVAPVVLAAENDLLWAEALVRTGGDLSLAATLINNTRVTRGHLTPATAVDGAAGLLADIQYEQDVELLTTGGGLQWYNRRRIDGLQTGTPRHLPVPAKELEIDKLPIYTFGGAAPNPVYPDQ
ncbi:MAG TPA: hypothetical protein VN734_09890 [Acidobacteriaceae bacterium]|jgi:hypothetical protein|nr:hypothetical protein [Acidobacteriaceae bacterium]